LRSEEGRVGTQSESPHASGNSTREADEVKENLELRAGKPVTPNGNALIIEGGGIKEKITWRLSTTTGREKDRSRSNGGQK